MHVRSVFPKPGECLRTLRRPAYRTQLRDAGGLRPSDESLRKTSLSDPRGERHGQGAVARAIYHHSKRAGKPFLAVNCAAITESLLESELFGYEKGAFTGADQRRIGKFEQCNGGTIFLDEVGDMSPLVQSKVLRVLQEQRFERVGGNDTIRTDVRIIAATNRDLETMVNDGKFRSDLYYRLNGFSIDLPPLRKHTGDLAVLIDYFLARFSRELGKEPHTLSPESMALLTKYHWPGNVRELQSVLKQALLQATGPVIIPDFLPETVRTARHTPPHAEPDGLPVDELQRFIDHRLESGSSNLYAEALELMEKYLLTRFASDGRQPIEGGVGLGDYAGSLPTRFAPGHFHRSDRSHRECPPSHASAMNQGSGYASNTSQSEASAPLIAWFRVRACRRPRDRSPANRCGQLLHHRAAATASAPRNWQPALSGYGGPFDFLGISLLDRVVQLSNNS